MTRIETPFGRHSTAAEVAHGIDLAGKRVIVTGAASGIGVETARVLASIGADVTLAVRDTDAGARVAAEISASTGNRNVHVARLDLADRASIGAFIAGWTGSLHVLVNNAGVMALPDRQLTAQGCEMQFAVNHLGHFALAIGLHDALAAADGARIVAVSSSAHMLSPVVFDDLHFAFRRYARSDRDEPATSHRRHEDASRETQDSRARCGDVCPACDITAARRDRRSLLRGLQRGRARNAADRRHGGRCALCARSRKCGATLGRIVAPAAVLIYQSG